MGAPSGAPLGGGAGGPCMTCEGKGTKVGKSGDTKPVHPPSYRLSGESEREQEKCTHTTCHTCSLLPNMRFETPYA